MRGGAIPVAVWGVLLAILAALNWAWSENTFQLWEWLFAVLVILLAAAALALASRVAGRRGAPAPSRPARTVQALPFRSTGAPLAAIAIAAVVFGLTFGHFTIYFGCALFVIALARLAVELRSARRSAERWRARPEADPGPERGAR